MSKLNNQLTLRLSRLGLSITLSLTLLSGLLLVMNFMAQAPQVHAAIITDKADPRLAQTDDSGKLNNIIPPIPTHSTTRSTTENVTTQAAFTSVIGITPTALLHEFEGAGLHLFDADHRSPITSTLNLTSVLDILGLKHLRVPFGPNWDHVNIPAPPACNDGTYTKDAQEMYNFVKQNFHSDFPDRLENAKIISGIAEKRNIEIIFLNWRAFAIWLTDLTFRELKEEYVDDYACFVAQVVKFLTDEGVIIRYLEPTNEPSETHDTKIPPTRYNTFVKLLRAYLDVEGKTGVKILAPSMAYFDHDETCRIYIEALDREGVNAISVWALHAWDPIFAPGAPEADILRSAWPPCYRAIKEKEGSGPSKPIFITEYACVNNSGNGICAVENMVTLLTLGANAVHYWYLREQSWDPDPANHERALLTETYAEKPTFMALRSVLPFISDDEIKVVETQVEGRITAAAFYKVSHATNERQVVVVLVNRFSESATTSITINGPLTSINQAMYDGHSQTFISNMGLAQCRVNEGRTSCKDVSLPPTTTLTVVFRGHNVYLPTIMKE